jgi:K+-sensing histidine kinase KdpD
VSSFVAGLITGCVIGVGGTTLLLLFVATLTDGYSDKMYELSLRGVACAAIALLAVAGLSYTMKLDKAGAILLLSLSVLVIAKLGGFRYGIGASVVAAMLLSLLFLPPIGILWVIGSDNRLALVLFLLSTIVGSRLIGGKKRLPG